jgi:hypothetical protein
VLYSTRLTLLKKNNSARVGVVVRVNQTHAKKTSTTPPFAELLPAAGPSVFYGRLSPKTWRSGKFRVEKSNFVDFSMNNRLIVFPPPPIRGAA